MIVDKKIFAVKCDGCGEICGAESDYDWWLTKEDAIKSMDGTYWQTVGDKHYCDDCWGYDDEDEIIIKKNESSTRVPRQASSKTDVICCGGLSVGTKKQLKCVHKKKF